MKSYSKDLIAASTIPIVLSILQRGDNYGYRIIKEVQTISGGELNWKEGSLYPVLAKLEQNGLITSYKKKENGRTRKYYAIHQDGIKFLADVKNEWSSINQILAKLWNIQPNLTFS
ncbi:PadR family transcriptional regulator [Flavilitoribacter nigricans]|uniref:PadR family transcriptional regulator n=1 Tax=Flavilitoribacter nigricans (strain ATCC 23147 / DSM 23189 / NBRC 102662 / NCIMB 1420 / SS-2) TaxID=1122177 RepID=A0A2D0NC19_FLAN2|nr:PadR family transcriptional regulator [Flavilitoribacter nigricans]PHN05936.1 PadR family transcriptional regulator [Flavilitoribacter nigricans DSM 23189 = NBRC 102662]